MNPRIFFWMRATQRDGRLRGRIQGTKAWLDCSLDLRGNGMAPQKLPFHIVKQSIRRFPSSTKVGQAHLLYDRLCANESGDCNVNEHGF